MVASRDLGTLKWPLAAAALTSVLGVMINYASSWNTNLWAWGAVALLTVLSALVAVAAQRRPTAGPESAGSGRIHIRTNRTATESTSEGLVLRTSTTQTALDGTTKTEVIEIFDVQVAQLRLQPPRT